MILNKVEKIMKGGIEKYAFQNSLDKANVQILVGIENEQLTYKMAENYSPKLTVDFKYILNKKIDVLGYEAISTPFLIKSIEHFAEKYDVDVSKTHVFITNVKDALVLVVYINYKQVEAVLLKEHFEQTLMHSE